MTLADPSQSTPPTPQQENKRKRKIPVFILIFVGLFLLAILFYMSVDSTHPQPEKGIPTDVSSSK